MATQVSTTRASRSPSLGLSFPMPLKGFGRVREGPRFQSPPNPPGLMSCPASPLREQPLWAKPPTLTITVPSGPPLGGPGHLQPGGTPSPPVSTGAPSSLSPSSPSFPGGSPAEPHVTTDSQVGGAPPVGRGRWSAVMTPYAGSVPSLSTFLFLLGSASLAVIYARPLCTRRSEALGL